VDQNAINVLKIRRLIRDRRYHEAQHLLRETRHVSVPVLDQQLKALILKTQPPHQSGIGFNRQTILAGLSSGALFGLLSVAGGLRDIYWMAALTLFGALFGLLLPEIMRRRQNTYDYFVGLYFERSRQRARQRR
jgi:hypothetical protein